MLALASWPRSSTAFAGTTIGGEGHPVGVASPGVMKETAHIGVATVLVAHGGNCLHQGVAG